MKCNARGQSWSLRPNSRCLGVPRTSITTIFGCILEIPIFGFLWGFWPLLIGHPWNNPIHIVPRHGTWSFSFYEDISMDNFATLSISFIVFILCPFMIWLIKEVMGWVRMIRKQSILVKETIALFHIQICHLSPSYFSGIYWISRQNHNLLLLIYCVYWKYWIFDAAHCSKEWSLKVKRVLRSWFDQ